MYFAANRANSPKTRLIRKPEITFVLTGRPSNEFILWSPKEMGNVTGEFRSHKLEIRKNLLFRHLFFPCSLSGLNTREWNTNGERVLQLFVVCRSLKNKV